MLFRSVAPNMEGDIRHIPTGGIPFAPVPLFSLTHCVPGENLVLHQNALYGGLLQCRARHCKRAYFPPLRYLTGEQQSNRWLPIECYLVSPTCRDLDGHCILTHMELLPYIQFAFSPMFLYIFTPTPSAGLV